MRQLEVITRFLLALGSTVVLFMGGISAPFAAIILLPLVAQPVLGFGLRYGTAWGMGVLLVAPLLFFVFAGEELALLYGVLALMTALLFGLLGRLRSIEFLVTGVAAALFAATGALLLYLFGSWTAMVDDFRESLTQQFMSALRIHGKIGFPADGLELFKERAPQLIDMTVQLLPALIFISLAFVVLVNVLLLCRRFPERRAHWLAVEKLREWKGPELIVWALIVCGFVLFIPGMEFAQIFAFNLLIILGACYFAQGLAVVAYFFEKNNVPRFLRALTYILIVFQQIFTLLVVGLGLFDLWGDFRRLEKKNLTPSQAA
jgi:uncharacterized protein YybS (DUF2232 family)